MSISYGHPDPGLRFDFYDGVPPKRLIAWVIDLGFTALIALPFILPFFAIGLVLLFQLLVIPVIWGITGFLYRWATLANGSATWGMRLMAIELRDTDGQHISGSTAFRHTLGSTLSFGFPLIQAIFVLFMATGDKGQGLTDMVLGTVMLNRAAP